MAALTFDILGHDRGAAAAFGKVASAMDKTGQSARKLEEQQLKIRSASVAGRKASLDLVSAQERLTRVTKDSTATDAEKRRAGLHVEEALLRQSRASAALEKANQPLAASSHEAARSFEHQERSGRSTHHMFGVLSVSAKGVGVAFKALGLGVFGAVALAGVGVGVLLGQMKGWIAEAREAAVTGKQTAAVIKSTGGAAHVTAGQVGDLATAISNKVGVDDEAIQSGQNMLLTFCLEASAQALSKDRGWVSHLELQPGDQILAYDPADDSVRWEPVTSMHRFQVDGDLIRWRSKQIDVATTPHHRWWTVGSSGRGAYEPRFRTTREVSGHQVYVKIGGGRPEACALEPTYSDDLVELLGWVFTEGWFPKWQDQTRPRRPRACSRCSRPARNLGGPAVCDACAVGPIQAGRTHPRAKVTAETSRLATVGLSQSQTANPKNVARIRELVDRLVAAGYTISETQYRAPYNDSTVSEWFFAGELGRQVRAALPGKKLTPRLLTSLTLEQAERFLDVLILADGHVGPAGDRQFIQKDPAQLELVAMLCALLGIRTTRLGRGDSLYLCSSNRLSGSGTNARLERYRGTVWCPHLRTGVFLARNNGRTFWTGNTNIRNETGKGRDVFTRASKTIVDMAAAMNHGVVDAAGLKTSAIQLGKALNDPVKGMTALQKVGVTFSKQQKDQIAGFIKHGQTAKAQGVILDELAKEFGGFAAASADPMQRLGVVFGNIKEALGTALLPYVDRFSVWLGEKAPAVTAKAVAALNTGIAGIKALGAGFSTGVQHGTGFVGFMSGLGVTVAAFGRWLTGTAIPAVRSFGTWIDTNKLTIAAWGLAVGQWATRIGGYLLIAAGYASKMHGYMTGAFSSTLKVIIDVAGGIIHAMTSAFGWVPGVGDKLHDAEDKFNKFKATATDGLDAAARSAGKTGDKLIGMGHSALSAADSLGRTRAQVNQLRDRKLVIEAIDRAKPVADRIARAIGAVHSRTVQVTVTQGGTVQRVQREINTLTGKIVSIQVGLVRGNLPKGFAGGVRNFAGGWAVAGEDGPELLHLPRGTDVYSKGESQAMTRPRSAAAWTGGGGGGDSRPVLVQLVLPDGKVLHETLLTHKRRYGELGLA